MRSPFLAAILLLPAVSLKAAEPCVTLDGKAVAALFDEWNFTLSSLDAKQVAQRYWPDAVLLPTVSNTPRTNTAMITDYFEHFLVKRPRGHINSRTIQSACNMAVDMGTYTFSLMDDKGATSEVAARYTFVYQFRDGAWKILHHHSSAMPERPEALAADAAPAAVKETKDSAKPTKPETPWKERRAWMRDPPKRKVEPKPPAENAPAVAAQSPEPAKSPEVAKPPEAAKLPEPVKPPELAKPNEAAKPAADVSAEQKPTREIRTAMFANLTSSPPPSKFYPPEAARRKEHGSVNLKVCTDGTGAVNGTMEVLKSSGSKLLDDAAMAWARAVTWVPATYNSRRVEGCATVDISFEPPPPEVVQARRS